MPKTVLDAIDRRILARLQDNARLSNADLAQAVGLSPSPCLRRVRALERAGVIQRYAALVDPVVAGLPISVFVQVSLERQAEPALELFERTVAGWPELMECYLMTGDADYLLRVVVSDIAAYERFLKERLTRVPGIASIKSSFALNQVKYETALPLAGSLRRGALSR
jgi:Lrp/AsnC family transcriptional regulator, leucine-responsive regulatory protein